MQPSGICPLLVYRNDHPAGSLGHHAWSAYSVYEHSCDSNRVGEGFHQRLDQHANAEKKIREIGVETMS